MSVHPDGTGTGWTNVEAVDVDQPHGKDYLYSQHIAKGVRKRMNQEHSAFADATVGGIHKPGGCAVLGMEITDDCTAPVVADGTYRGHGLVWSYSKDTSNFGILWCTTGAAGASTTGDWTVLKMHPDLQWSGGDITWAGAHEFDASVDFTGTVHIDGAFEVDSSSDVSDVYINGDLSMTGSLKIATDLSLSGDLAVDGSANYFGEIDCSVVSIEDFTGTAKQRVCSAWAYFEFTTNTILASYNVANIDWSSDGVCCVSFSNSMPSANYAVATGQLDTYRFNHILNQAAAGFDFKKYTAGGALSNTGNNHFVVFGSN